MGICAELVEDLPGADAEIISSGGDGHDIDELGVGVPIPPPEAWTLMSEVSSLGYIYHDGRSVMRIQRGKPQHSVTVNCYHHPGCRMLLSEKMCPSDSILKQWFWEVEAPAIGASAAIRKQLAESHMRMGKARWQVGRSTSASSSQV